MMAMTQGGNILSKTILLPKTIDLWLLLNICHLLLYIILIINS